MTQIDLSGKWKLRGEFLDVTAERFYEVANKKDGKYHLYKGKEITIYNSTEQPRTVAVKF